MSYITTVPGRPICSSLALHLNAYEVVDDEGADEIDERVGVRLHLDPQARIVFGVADVAVLHRTARSDTDA